MLRIHSVFADNFMLESTKEIIKSPRYQLPGIFISTFYYTVVRRISRDIVITENSKSKIWYVSTTLFRLPAETP